MPWVINNASDSESPGEKWQCFNCGFNNRSHNQVCGGTGPMGCKAPKLMAEMMSYQAQAMASWGGSYGPMRSMKMNKISPSPYASGSWLCVCGFNNRPQNSVCGGTGPIGCKMPRPREGHSATEALMQLAMWEPPGKGKGGPMDAHQFCKGKGSMGMGFRPDRSMSMGMGMGMGMGFRPDRTMCMRATTDMAGATEWVCVCGFRNRAQNRVCGGTGSMGCKAERPSTTVISPPKIKMEPAASFDWLCIGCGFVNKPGNSICGGKGPLGCKAPKPSDDELAASTTYQRAGSQCRSRERTHEKKFDWLCECGFINKPHNTVCGGKGPMGCKLPKPDDQ